MKILTLLGFLVLLTISQMTNCFPGQFNAVPTPIPRNHLKPVAGSNFGLLALIIIIFSILLTPRCPWGYTLISNKCGRFCYRFEAQNCKSWAEASAACKGEGAKLMKPETCSYPLFQSLAPKKAGQCTDFWIGALRTPPSVTYVKVGGAPLPSNFKFWARGQPDRAGSLGGLQACVQMADELEYLMNDDGCNEMAGYICQIYI
ncbi:hypothetical protein ACJMK2_039489 [Sinanodonta woodiana]|uniref:C-type lectin domain-containing protein n=1 Tax=Sinanodonta woodiana TaxID=1069815 RepID=A0ABD3WG40_SINWO